MRISDWSSDVCSSDLQPLGRGGLHADPVEGQAQYFRDPATHRIPMRTDFRGLANQRQVDMFDEAVPFCDALRRIFQETVGGDAAQLRVGWREVAAYVSLRPRPAPGVPPGLGAHIPLAI